MIRRYRAKIVTAEHHRCQWWTGAITAKGHGRFWVGPDPDRAGHGFVIIAHRFGYGLRFGFDALLAAPVLGHDVCDNPLCQDPTHLKAMTSAQNTASGAVRRHNLAGALRDQRGARNRALAVRAALRAGHSPTGALTAGTPPVERDQLPLW